MAMTEKQRQELVKEGQRLYARHWRRRNREKNKAAQDRFYQRYAEKHAAQ